jgi:hypothetical protein
MTAALSAPGTKAGRLQRACLAVLRQHEATGALPTSARFVYYELKQAGVATGTHAARRADQGRDRRGDASPRGGRDPVGVDR